MKRLLCVVLLVIAGCAKPVPVPAPIPTPVTIAVVNQSAVVTDADAAQAVADIQLQIARDFVPAWNLPTTVTYYGHANPPAGSWTLFIRDDTDKPGDCGYHNPTEPPTGFVFANTCGGFWTVTLSHELIEMRTDPKVDQTMIVSLNGASLLITKEPCDPVGASTYLVGNTPVSNFVFPSWFQTSGVAPFDHLGQVTAPFQVVFGGNLP